MTKQANQIETLAKGIYKVHSEDLLGLNEALLKGFLKYEHDETVKRTHLFNGRYENIYLNEHHIPELKLLMRHAHEVAKTLLESSEVASGYWFNYMPHGSVTTLHSHDDFDELLSAAYYVSVPAHSGDLIIHAKSGAVRVQPEAGSFIFFNPEVAHEVTENKSGEGRLSIGINFGLKRHENDD